MAIKVYMRLFSITSLGPCHVAPFAVFSKHWGPPLLSRTMSSQSHPKDTKHPRFGHLPLSTSGPEECALTVMRCLSISSLGPGLTKCRVHRSSALRIIIKVPHSLRMSVKILSSMVCCLQMCKRWMNKSNGHMSSIANAEMPSGRTLS